MSQHRAKKIDGDPDRKGSRGQPGSAPGLLPLLQPGKMGLRAPDQLRKLADGQPLCLPGDSDSQADDRVDVVHEPNIRATNAESQVEPVDARIGRRVRALREAAGIRQIDFAKMIGVSQPNLSKMEGGATWSAMQVSAACAALHCMPSDLMAEVPPSELQHCVLAAMNDGDYMAAVEAVTLFFKEKR